MSDRKGSFPLALFCLGGVCTVSYNCYFRFNIETRIVCAVRGMKKWIKFRRHDKWQSNLKPIYNEYTLHNSKHVRAQWETCEKKLPALSKIQTAWFTFSIYIVLAEKVPKWNKSLFWSIRTSQGISRVNIWMLNLHSMSAQTVSERNAISTCDMPSCVCLLIRSIFNREQVERVKANILSLHSYATFIIEF